MRNESVDHPQHYGGADDPYEVIKVAEAWGFDGDAYLFNVLKYIRRDKDDELEDLKKARFYLDRKIKRMEQTAAEHVAALTEPKLLQYPTIELVAPGQGPENFRQYNIVANSDWTIKHMCEIVASQFNLDTQGREYGISLSPGSGFLASDGKVSWLLKMWPPATHQYYLRLRGVTT